MQKGADMAPSPDSKNIEELRRQAEAYLADHPKDAGSGALIGDMQALLHELNVYRVELEMQNEELRAAQLELEAARQAYSDLYDFSPVGYLTMNVKGLIKVANLTAASLLGTPRGRLVGQNLSKFFAFEDRDALFLHRKAVLDNVVQQVCTLRMQTVDGAPFHARLVSAAVLDDEGEPGSWRMVFYDVSALVQAEVALTAAQKLAGIGTLSAGIAHEINSPLQIITGLSERMLSRLPKNEMPPKKMLEDAATINRNAWRIATIVRSLLSYARATQEDYLLEDLSKIVEDTLHLIEYQLKTRDNISVVKDLALSMPPCTCNAGGISQVLINLLTNAADAMAFTGGQITIHTRYDPEKQRFMLQVADTGEGIPAAISGKIFEPFWTTKEVGKGSGLGLSVSQGIVHAHGGEITVDSPPGRGATFTVWLPKNAPASQPDANGGRY